MPIIEAPTITSLPPEAAGAVVVSGSHGGHYPGYLAAKARLRAVIFNDAGVGRDGAGIASLAVSGALRHRRSGGEPRERPHRRRCRHDAPAASSPTPTRRRRLWASCPEWRVAPPRSGSWPPPQSEVAPEPFGETRSVLELPGAARRVVLVDSAAQVEPVDAGQIVVTGSHGGLVGGDPRLALRVAGYAGVFNDAGIGIDDAGTTRLPALDARGIPAFTVSVASAAIGDAQSTYRDGIISVVNRAAQALGARPGLRAREVIDLWAHGG